MPKIKRRYRVVPLFQGNYEADLAVLLDKTMAAHRAEAAEEAASEGGGPPLRAGQKAKAKAPKKSIEYARQYDEVLTEAEETAEKVAVWAVAYDEWSWLADEHPPRDEVAEDKERGVNTKTFPPELLRASLGDPNDEDITGTPGERVAVLIAKGEKILAGLGLSRIHYVKLETAAWNVNVEGDLIPKDFSLVSFLIEENASGSKPPSDTE